MPFVSPSSRLFSTKSNAPVMPEMLDLSCSQETIVGAENPSQWGFDLQRVADL